jgi:hypothetical protein
MACTPHACVYACVCVCACVRACVCGKGGMGWDGRDWDWDWDGTGTWTGTGTGTGTGVGWGKGCKGIRPLPVVVEHHLHRSGRVIALCRCPSRRGMHPRGALTDATDRCGYDRPLRADRIRSGRCGAAGAPTDTAGAYCTGAGTARPARCAARSSGSCRPCASRPTRPLGSASSTHDATRTMRRARCDAHDAMSVRARVADSRRHRSRLSLPLGSASSEHDSVCVCSYVWGRADGGSPGVPLGGSRSSRHRNGRAQPCSVRMRAHACACMRAGMCVFHVLVCGCAPACGSKCTLTRAPSVRL